MFLVIEAFFVKYTIPTDKMEETWQNFKHQTAAFHTIKHGSPFNNKIIPQIFCVK